MAGSFSYLAVVNNDVVEGAEFYDEDVFAAAVNLGEDKYLSPENYTAAKSLADAITTMLRATGNLPAGKKLEIVSGN
jgi:hypothetical protein